MTAPKNSMTQTIFDHDDKHREMFERLLLRPAPQRQYVIHFTPRSGSSWLTDLAERSGVLGSPRECFNPAFMPQMVHSLGARSMEEYIDVLGRRFQGQETWGFEVTHFQIIASFGSAEAFMDYFASYRPVWLIREDIVLQAVSLAKMAQTGASHSVSISAEDRKQLDARFSYNAEDIGKWLLHIRRMEELSEHMFQEFGQSPLRLSYELIMGHEPIEVIRAISLWLDAAPPSAEALQPSHEKIGTARNLEFADRFRSEEDGFCADVAADRAAMLASVARPLS